MALLWAVFLGGCDLFHTGFEPVEPAERYQAASLSPADGPDGPLVVLDWNVKFGGGRLDFFFDCHGTRSLMTLDEVTKHLEGLAAKIQDIAPDVVLLQEVDVESKRSAYVDMVQWLLDHTALNHGVYGSQWRADYVPSDGIGRVNSGNAILSRFPFGEATRIALPEVAEYDALKRYFYLKRNVLRAQLLVGNREDLYVVTTHSEAYSRDGTKRAHIDGFQNVLDQLDDEGRQVLGGGDLNGIPPGSVTTHDFPDSVCTDEEFQADDYREEASWLDGLYERYGAAIELAQYQDPDLQSRFYTHTTDKDGFWNRKLDYLFTNGTFVPGSALTHQATGSGGMETMPLSDHAPVSVLWQPSP